MNEFAELHASRPSPLASMLHMPKWIYVSRAYVPTCFRVLRAFVPVYFLRLKVKMCFKVSVNAA